MKVDWKNNSIRKHDFKTEDYNSVIDSNLMELVKIKEFFEKTQSFISLCHENILSPFPHLHIHT